MTIFVICVGSSLLSKATDVTFFSVSRGNAGCYVCVQKENMLSCQCDMDNGDSTFYPPFP